VEEPEERIVHRKLYYTGIAFIKYRGELHRPLTGEKGKDHYRLEHYYDIKIHDIKQVSEEYFMSLPEVLSLNGSHGEIRACHEKEQYDLDTEILIVTGQGKVAHEQIEGGEIHGYFEQVPVAFRMEREETILVSDPVDVIDPPLEEEEDAIISDPPPPEPARKKDLRRDSRTTNRFTSTDGSSGWGCLVGVFGLLLAGWVILHLFSILTSGVGLAFLLWITVVAIGFLIGWCIDLFQRFPRTGSFIFGFFRWGFSLFFLLFLVNGIMHLPDGNKRSDRENAGNESVRDTVTIETVDPEPDQLDRTDNTNNDSLRQIVVRMRWKNLSGQPYSGSYALYADDIATSGERLQKYQAFWGTEYRDIYGYVSSYDRSHMRGVFSMLDSIRSADSLSEYQFAEVVVTMVQSIDYVLILDGSCSGRQEEPAIAELLQSSVPCLGHAPYGLRTPLQFLSDMKGDCDTRTVVLYNLLKHYGYDVAIINSQFYTHSMLGLNLSGVTGNYKIYDGKRYYFWETTDKGFPLGALPPEAGNRNYWNVELN
jgi:hypothetical protein